MNSALHDQAMPDPLVTGSPELVQDFDTSALDALEAAAYAQRGYHQPGAAPLAAPQQQQIPCMPGQGPANQGVHLGAAPQQQQHPPQQTAHYQQQAQAHRNSGGQQQHAWHYPQPQQPHFQQQQQQYHQQRPPQQQQQQPFQVPSWASGVAAPTNPASHQHAPASFQHSDGYMGTSVAMQRQQQQQQQWPQAQPAQQQALASGAQAQKKQASLYKMWGSRPAVPMGSGGQGSDNAGALPSSGRGAGSSGFQIAPGPVGSGRAAPSGPLGGTAAGDIGE